jgi:XTP/dITP diphosphohydrolase
VRLVVATHNRHKTGEFAAVFDGAAELSDLTGFPGVAPTDESGATFEENATLKALAASRALPGSPLVIADDSGLEVDALGGEPGIRSARYAGEGATDAANRTKLLGELERVGARGRARTARFHCCLVAARDGAKLAVFHGTVEGVIGTVEKGQGGFGYDALFIPDGYCETFAQLPAATKNAISHRGRALAQALPWIRRDAGACV